MQNIHTGTNQSQRLHIDHHSSSIKLENYQSSLQYLIISTQPGRKVFYPPRQQQECIIFNFQNCPGISIDREGFCCLGFDSSLSQIKENIQRKLQTACVQKIICISKINIHIKLQIPETSSKRIKHLSTQVSQSGNVQDKYNFKILVVPPQDLTAEEIQQLLEKSVNEYGTICKVDVNRNCLIVSFNDNVEIKTSFVVKDTQKLKNGDLVLTYWAITNHRTLFTFEPSKLIRFPFEIKVRDMLIVSQWAIISTNQDVFFLHLYRPQQNYLTLKNVQVQSMQILDQDRVILFEYKYFHIYHLFTHKNPVLLGRAKTKKLKSYSVALRKKTALFGGINYSQILNDPTKDKQILVIQNFTTANLVNKEFLPDKTLCICKKKQETPVTNLKYLEHSDLFVCSCGESIFLFHLDSSSLIASVDLSSPVQKLFQIQYPINFVNCLVKTKKESNLIRVSFEQNGQLIGTEVTGLDKYGEAKDFMAKGKDVYLTDTEMVLLYGESHKSKVLFCLENSNEKIDKISVFHEFLTFLIKKQDSSEIYFVEL